MATQNNNIAGSGYGNPYTDSLIYGDGWKDWMNSPITYTFLSGYGYSDSYGSMYGDSWSPTEISAFGRAFDSYSAVCNLKFSVSSNNNYLANTGLWKLSSSYMGTIFGLFQTPNETYSQIYGHFNGSISSSWNYLANGGDGYNTIVHELGHALGLAHPHDGGGESTHTTFPGVTYRDDTDKGDYDLNQSIWTVMSYNPGWEVQPCTTLAYGNAFTPMTFDIAALQTLYGANTSYHTGTDSYVLPTSNTVGTGWSCIWDAGGIDTINGASTTGGCEIYLIAAPLTGAHAGGWVSYMHGIVGGFTIANNVVIENATGGSGDDFIYGNDSNNVLQGGAGNDTLGGGGGNDILIGGSGDADCAMYVDARSNYAISYSSGTYTITDITGSDGTDTVTGVEYLWFNDNHSLAVSSLDFTPPHHCH